MAGRAPLARVKEVLEAGFADLYDAFAEMDTDRDGKVSLEDFVQTIKTLDGGEDLSSDQIDAAFNQCAGGSDGLIVFKGFHAAFIGKAAGRAAADTGEMSSGVVPRAFQEVLMECKDAEGVQKFIAVSSTMTWPAVLQKLKLKYGRAVTFMYEADGHTYTVKDERDFKLCWDSVEEAYKKANAVTPSAHLVAFIINVDPSQLAAGVGKGKSAARKGHMVPKRVTISATSPGETSLSAAARPDEPRRQVMKEQFEAKHAWIDNMLSQTGAQDSEPTNLRKRGWDKLQKACAELDVRREKSLSVEAFKNALNKTDATLNSAQVQWYVKDASATSSSAGQILYEKYCELKKTGKSMRESEGTEESVIRESSSRIKSAIRERYKTVQVAFKKFDEDKDGFIHKKDLRDAIEFRLKLKPTIPSRVLDEIFKRADSKDDDRLDYEEFIEYFRMVASADEVGPDGTMDHLSNEKLMTIVMRTFGSVGQLFEELDADGDGTVTKEELKGGLAKNGIKLSMKRILELLHDLGRTGNEANVDYRKLLQSMSKVSLSAGASESDDVGREEARVRDKIRAHYKDAKEAFHAFNASKDGRLSRDEFFKGLDSIFAPEVFPQAIKNRLLTRADVDSDGFLAYHEFLARFGVRPSMRQSLGVQEKISMAVQTLFADSMHKAFEAMDGTKDMRLDRNDFKQSIESVLKIKCSQDELDPFLDSIDKEGMDFQQFLVRFGLSFKSKGRWQFEKEKGVEKVSADSAEAKIFRRSLGASKWFGRGGIKKALLKATSTGSMHRHAQQDAEHAWEALKIQCQTQTDTGTNFISFDKLKASMQKIDTNFTDDQIKHFKSKYLSEKIDEHGIKKSPYVNEMDTEQIDFIKLCDEMHEKGHTLAQLNLKEFGNALRDTLGMGALTSEEVTLLAGKGINAGLPKSWWIRQNNAVDVDEFIERFIEREFKNDLLLFEVMVKKNKWVDIHRVMTSLNTAPDPKKEFITRGDLKATFARLEAMGTVTSKESEAILRKIETDDLFEKEGAHVGQLDYRKNFLNHYMPEEIKLHSMVYPYWKDCAEKFERFSTSGETDASKIGLSYRQFRELVRQFTFSRDMTPAQLEILIDLMDEDGDGDISLEEFKNRYARDEARIMDAVHKNWQEIKECLATATKRKVRNGKNRLDRPEFQQELIECNRKGLLPGVSDEQIVSLVVALDPGLVIDKEVTWDLWLQAYAGDYYLIHQAFQPGNQQQKYKLHPWEMVVSCFEITESSRELKHTRAWRMLRDDRKAECPICQSKQCMWFRDFNAEDMVSWDEFKTVLERAGIVLGARLLNKLLDALDPEMHGFIHWRAFVEGRVPFFKSPIDPPQAGQGKHCVLSAPGAGPYFLNGIQHYRVRQVLVAAWADLLRECDRARKKESQEVQEKAAKENKEVKPTNEGTLDAKKFDACVKAIFKDQLEPPKVVAGDDEPLVDSKAPKMEKKVVDDMATSASKIAKAAFEVSATDKRINFHAFCQNYSQGDFNADRYIQRKWENLYQDLKTRDEDEDADGLESKSAVKKALEIPQLGLSANMIKRLLKEYQEEALDDGDEEDDEPLVNYVNLCWRFARHNIQSVMERNCLLFFRKARQLDKGRSKQISKIDMMGPRVLRHPDLGLSECEAEIFVRKYSADKTADKADSEILLDYDSLLAGKWEDLPCNPKLYNAFVALERNWQRISERFRSSDTVNDGKIHLDDFTKQVLELRIEGLRDRDAVEQVGQDLGPDAHGQLNFDEFQWKMSSELLVEILAPNAPLLLNAFRSRLIKLRTEYLKYKALQQYILRRGGAEREEMQEKKMVIQPHQLKAMELAFDENVLSVKSTEEVVREFLKRLGFLQDTGERRNEELPEDVADTDGGNSGVQAKVGGGVGGKDEKGKDAIKDQTSSGKISATHVKILVERMDVARSDRTQVAGFVTEESMLLVLREFAHDQIFEHDLSSFQTSLGTMIRSALAEAADSWVDPDQGSRHIDNVKEFTGMVVHEKGVLQEIGRAPIRRPHMRAYFQGGCATLPEALRPSSKLATLAQDRHRRVYLSDPWRTFWQESSRKVRMRPGEGGGGRKGAVHVGKNGARQEGIAGEEREAGKNQIASGDKVLIEAQEKVRKGLFERFDHIREAFLALDRSHSGVVSLTNFKQGLSDLGIGLTAQQVDALVVAEGGGEFITYQDMLDKYSTRVSSLADIAQRRSSSDTLLRVCDKADSQAGERGMSVYARLRKDLGTDPRAQERAVRRGSVGEEGQDRGSCDAAPAGLDTGAPHAHVTAQQQEEGAEDQVNAALDLYVTPGQASQPGHQV